LRAVLTCPPKTGPEFMLGFHELACSPISGSDLKYKEEGPPPMLAWVPSIVAKDPPWGAG